jgi:periplasmic divalent cation tolerance protein
VTELCEVVITAPDPNWLRDFTRALVVDRLCSSVHNFTPVQSTYRWQGEIHDRTEGRASLHTRRSLIPEIVRRAKEAHPYQVPGISARPIYDGNPEYLDWIATETQSSDER